MWGEIISAGANILGGILGRNQQQKQADLQKEFAKSGIQWRVKDAQKAGIHPIYALGAQTHSYSPQSVGDPLAQGIANAGQNIGRAVHAGSSHNQRMEQLQLGMLEKQMAKTDAEIALLNSQAARINQQGVPSVPSLTDRFPPGLQGQGDAKLQALGITSKPLEVTGRSPENPAVEIGSIPDVGYAATAGGRAHMPVPSADVKQRIEDNIFQEAAWWFRNNVMPAFGGNSQPPPGLKPGNVWMFHPIYGYFQVEGPRERHNITGRFPGYGGHTRFFERR